MTDNEAKPDQDKLALELYKIAFARLNFQDEYLFKFSTVFLTAHGALAVLAGTGAFKDADPNYTLLAIVAAVGVFLAIAWSVWTIHNDYWHSVWIGTLRQIEAGLQTYARVFDADHRAIAKQGKRKGYMPAGHSVALLLPGGLGIAWVVTLVIGLAHCE